MRCTRSRTCACFFLLARLSFRLGDRGRYPINTQLLLRFLQSNANSTADESISIAQLRFCSAPHDYASASGLDACDSDPYCIYKTLVGRIYYLRNLHRNPSRKLAMARCGPIVRRSDRSLHCNSFHSTELSFCSLASFSALHTWRYFDHIGVYFWLAAIGDLTTAKRHRRAPSQCCRRPAIVFAARGDVRWLPDS